MNNRSTVIAAILATCVMSVQGTVCYWTQTYQDGRFVWGLHGVDEVSCTSYRMGGLGNPAPPKTEHAPTDKVDDTDDMPQLPCPDNASYRDCTCNQLCDNPSVCVNTCVGSLTQGCVCLDGYYLRGGICVPPNQCGCYSQEEKIIIPENGHYVTQACTILLSCSDGQLSEHNYSCSPDTVCEERYGIRGCYCKNGYTGDQASCTMHAMDCQAWYDAGNTSSGVYQIKPLSSTEAFDVGCNMTSSGEGWTVFQRRVNGSVDFHLDWDAYKSGFGSADHEYWLGNERLFHLTHQRNYILRIDMVLRNNTPIHAEYDSFKIKDGEYHIYSLGAFSGDGDFDGFRSSFNQSFSTLDDDNDGTSGRNCAVKRGGGWWYGNCGSSNLNSYYNVDDGSRWNSIAWNVHDDNYRHMKYTEMKLLPNRQRL